MNCCSISMVYRQFCLVAEKEGFGCIRVRECNANEGVAAVETGGKRRSSASHSIIQIPHVLLRQKITPIQLDGCYFLAEKEGFEPSIPFWGIHDFQSCALGQLRDFSKSLFSLSQDILQYLWPFVKTYFWFFREKIALPFSFSSCKIKIEKDAIKQHSRGLLI